MAASTVAAARAVIHRVARTAAAATSSPPVTASTVAAARAVIHRVARTAAAATSSPPVTASAAATARVMICGLMSSAAPASPPSSSTVTAPATFTPPSSSTVTAPATFSPPSSSTVTAPATFMPPSSSMVTASATVTGGSGSRAVTTAAVPSTAPPPPAPKKLLMPPYRRFWSSTATTTPTPPPPTAISPRNVQYLIDLLNGLVLTKEDELMFRQAFNQRFRHFKVADIFSHKADDFTAEECIFLLKMIGSKFDKEGLAQVSQEDINFEVILLARLDTKLDTLMKMVVEGNDEILKHVKSLNKSEWGSVEIFGKKLDLSKLEDVKRLIYYILGM